MPSNIPPSPLLETSTLVKTFAFSGTLGLGTVMLAQTALSVATGKVLFGPAWGEVLTEVQRLSVAGLSTTEVARRAEIAHSWRWVAFLGVFSFAGAGLVEEAIVKLAPVAWLRRRAGSVIGPKENVTIALASALGFGVVEMLSYAWAAVEAGESGWALLTTLAERFVVGIPGHCLTAVLIALRASRKGLGGGVMGAMDIMAPSILFHGTANSILFGLCARDGNPGWIRPTDGRVVASVYGTFALLWAGVGALIRREWQMLS